MRKITSLILIFALLLSFSVTVGAYELPKEIRVGLFYGSSAKAEYSITAKSGVSITGGGGTYITEDSAATSVAVKRDEFYHAKINSEFATAYDAWSVANTLRAAGLNAFYLLDGSSFSVYAQNCTTEQDAANAAAIATAAGYEAIAVSPLPLGVIVYINDVPWTGSASSGVRIFPLSGNAKIDDKEYRGYFEFYRDEKSDMAAVNVVGIEDYLMGVVPREVSPTWHTEAVKAQAIVARTYAATNMNKFSSYGFNVDNTTQSQVYGGVSSEHELSNAAVMETAGKLVMYNGKPAEVFFFSSSGGMTENVENVWGGAPRDYLVSVSDSYENPLEASYANWTIKLTPAEVAEKLLKLNINIGEVTDITLDETSPSGRSLKTTVHGTNGSHTFTFEKARTSLGLYSNLFTISREGGENPSLSVLSGLNVVNIPLGSFYSQSANGVGITSGTVTITGANGTKTYAKTSGTGDFIITGKGWGHGIGMSQWGAKGMAEASFTCEEIVKHYFKGTEVS